MADDKSVSYILTTLLNSLGLDEEQRQKRITYQKINQLLLILKYKLTTPGYIPLLSGSSFETTTIDGLSSDVDIMLNDTDTRVIADIEDWKGDGVPTYLMDSTGCYKAFVKLYKLSPDYPGPVYADMLPSLPLDHHMDADGHVLMSNKITQRKFDIDAGQVHGPAITFPEEITCLETDHVYALRCDTFPREAVGWKQRQTPLTRTRIDPSIIDDINHCYLVAVGDKNSPNEHLEWRLSFSHIENHLVHAWNNVQYHCYIFFKFIQKDLIKPIVPDILCSYHFKTLIMWMNEEHQTRFFTAINLEQCILACLKNLSVSVRKKSLPHYFVQGCNLFYPKLTNNPDTAKALLAVIDDIVAKWPRCLFNISRCYFGRMFHNSFKRQSSLPGICSRVHERRRHDGFWLELLNEQNNVCQFYLELRESLMYKSTDAFCILSELCQMSKYNNESRRFVSFACRDILCNVSIEWILSNNLVSNKTALRNQTSGVRFIQRYVDSCCIDTGLTIAAHFVMTGRHHQAISFLDRLESRVRNYTVFRCIHPNCVNFVSTGNTVAVYDNKPSMTEFCTHYYGAALTYKQKKMSHVPKGLVYEMFRSTSISSLSDPRHYSWHSQAIIHCPVYLYYIRFLIYNAVGQKTHEHVALKNMEWAAKQRSKYRGTHQETNHNIIGHCHRSTGDTRRAYKEYRKSLSLEKYNNAVLWHMAVLLRRQLRGNDK